MIKHIVLFKMKAFASENEKQSKLKEIKVQLEKLPRSIPELKNIQVGINCNPAEKWDLALEAEVENMRHLEIYAKHPDHQDIVQRLILPLKEERACIDYEF